MNVRQNFESHFSEQKLKQIYSDHVLLSAAKGIDNIGHRAFWPNLDKQISIASRKVLAGTYTFSKYRLKLISKGRRKYPREISIPTIRDRIVLRAICEFLSDRFAGALHSDLPQIVTRQIISELEPSKFDSFVKLDVENFYPTINGAELRRRLRRRIPNVEILNLIERAITTPTVVSPTSDDEAPTTGIPQGLSVSNLLATIYLLNIDRKYKTYPGIRYFRYVDDVLVLCNKDDINEVADDIRKSFRKIKLVVHRPSPSSTKSMSGRIAESFDYLGYQYTWPKVSVRKNSIEKLRNSIAAIFTGYKHSNRQSEKFLLWRLNLRITGCVFESTFKGWLFFFSEINDKQLLHSLDHYVDQMCTRFGVSISPKRFVRAYFQIQHRRHDSRYIPNFDNFDIGQMREVLEAFFGKSTARLANSEIEFEFRKRITRQVRDLQSDIQGVGISQ